VSARPEPAPHHLDWTVHPGHVIRDELTIRKMRQVEFAHRTRFTPRHITRVLHGQVQVTADLALATEAVLGIPAHVLMRMQADNTLWHAAQRRRKGQ